MSSPVASPVKISARLERGQELTEHGAVSGLRCLESFAKFDRDSRSWKTPQCSLLGDCTEFSETWPKQGIMQLGWCWKLPMWELRTGATESGFLQRILKFGTPTAAMRPRSQKFRGISKLPNPAEVAEMELQKWPIQQASDYKRASYTPEALQKRLQGHQKGLPEAVSSRELFPTPTCQDAKNNGSQSQQNRNSKPLNAVAGGALNPPWVEWLMGWPTGWTDLKPLAMDKFHSWLQLHSASLKKLLNVN